MSDLTSQFVGTTPKPESVPVSRPLRAAEIPLFTSRELKREFATEQPWHRTVAYLSVRGMTSQEIGEAVGKSPAAVQHVKKQPIFHKMCAHLIAEHNLIDDTATNLLKNASAEAALKVIDLMNNAKSGATQLKAAETLLDRVFGKATQIVEHKKTRTPVDPQAEIAQLTAEIDSLQRRAGVEIKDITALNSRS